MKRVWRNNTLLLGGRINKMVNDLETITYHKHHYVRKKELKKAIKKLIEEEKLT